MSFLRTFWSFIDSNFLSGMEGIGGKDEQYSSHYAIITQSHNSHMSQATQDDRLFPLNDFELNTFRYQLAQMSNLEDTRDAPMVSDDAGHLPDDSTHGAWKDRILGRENSW